jgi:exodeoxyribonuclease VII small subunit
VTKPAPEPGYAEAMQEIEQILAEIEDDQVDVDVLAVRVSRAAELIRLCRERITATRMQVEQVVAELATETTPEQGKEPA